MAFAAVGLALAGPATGSAAAAKPANSFPPEVVGSARLGERLVCGVGTWTGAVEAPPGEETGFQYEWVREGITVSARAHKNLTYTLTKADEHLAVWCIVTAEGKEGISEPAESWNSVCLNGGCGEGGVPPKNTAPPSVSGTAAVGQTLTCSQGTWSGTTPLTFTYKWLRDKEAIAAATGNAYTVVGEDEGHALSCKVTATNAAGEASAESANSVEITASLPEPKEAPQVLGIPAAEERLTCGVGIWSGSSPLTFTFQWLRDGKTLAIATGDIYEVEAADEGHKIACRVTGTNAAGKAEAASTAVLISVRPPTSTARPVVSGTPEEGHTLTCSTGTWTGAPTSYEYQWAREEAPIPSATSNKYTVVSADVGKALYCDVTAINGGGSKTRRSGPAIRQGSKPPTPTTQPEVSGLPISGQELTCEPGLWSGSPTQFVYQWVRDRGLPDETSLETGIFSKYKVGSADEGHLLSCAVTAINGEGSGEAESEPLGVKGKPPKNLVAPELSGASGTLHVGESVTCVRGEWEAAPKPTFAYKWLRGGVEVASATASVYTVAEADRGHSLACVVTATNSEGTAPATSQPVHIPGSQPVNIEGPSITGSPEVGAPLTCAEGKWSGAPIPTPQYQWLLNNVNIPSATSSKYTVTSADRGLSLTCKVTATNSEGTGFATSLPVHVLGIPPIDPVKPHVAGTAALGQTLTCQTGIWEGDPPPVFTYQWLRDQTPIASATENTYAVESADQGHVLSCKVEATNIEGRGEAQSDNRLEVAVRTTTNKDTPLTPPTGGPTPPTAAQILAALSVQLERAQSSVRTAALVKTGGYAFPFVTPAVGTLELVWYEFVKGAHGKTTRLVVAQSKTPFAKALTRGLVRLRLTAQGRRAIGHARHTRLTARAVFRVSHGASITWLKTFLLRH